jgi:hypothetical protein
MDISKERIYTFLFASLMNGLKVGKTHNSVKSGNSTMRRGKNKGQRMDDEYIQPPNKNHLFGTLT